MSWADHVANADIRMGTVAHHKLGDISRERPDYLYVDREDGADLIGEWLTGFGFVEVRFPKATVRPMTDDERQWLLDHPTVLV